MTYKVDDAAFRKAIDKWEETAPIEFLLNITALKEHMLNENGIKFNSSLFNSDMMVVDEQKYLMFVLRYT